MRKLGAVLFVSLLLMLATVTLTVSAQTVNVVKNGSFEEGFINGVGQGWEPFHNDGLAAYGWEDDTWAPVVYEGGHSQIIAVQTSGVGSEKDRYVGIYQVVDVVPDARYMFSFYGMTRTTEGTAEKSSFNYRVEVGFDYNGGTNPWAVTEWTEMDRWPEYTILEPGSFQGYAHGITPTTNKLTVFIRLWKKFPTTLEKGIFNVDAVSLLGPAAAATKTTTASGDTVATLPNTGGGFLLPLAGIILAVLAIALTGRRLIRQRHER